MERRLTKQEIIIIRRNIAEKENDPEAPPLTILEAQIALLDWLASLGHKVEY